ncbi:hypothetical protein AB0I81_53665 [Nonomuraea sp. NPDC050404]|uniref:hypothetical protein n=1 Tax=Nonomuraea sp. NPDC050404 TaxID=3155783 RepID=UPI0033F47C56
MVAAERALEEDDPDRAHEHTKVARRFAARIGVVREAAGIVAYHAGHFSEALSDLRAARRMTGSEAYLPIMADCERGLGRPERAIDLVRSPEAERLDRDGRIELTIVESGARRDLGQHDAAVITLQRLPELRDPQPKPWSARLAFAYADALADAGHQDAATEWFGKAMAFDEDGETDAAERYAELTGAVIEDVEEDFDDEDESDDAADADVVEAARDVADEESDDESALAEADDLLEDAEPADIQDEAAETAGSGDVPDETPGDAEPGDVPDGAGSGEVSDQASAGAGSGEVPDETAGKAAAPAPAPADVLDEEESASASDTLTAGQDKPGAGDSEDDKPAASRDAATEPADLAAEQSAEQSAEVPGITPAFIEPNFGDVLNEAGESTEDKPKTDG